MNIKKYNPRVLAAGMALVLFLIPTHTVAYARTDEETKPAARATMRSLFSGRAYQRRSPVYNDPGGVVIAQPPDNMETDAPHVSILGACDPGRPLYMNGREIQTTPRGFFTCYVSLAEGDNVFTFQCGGAEKSVTVTRVPAAPKAAVKQVRYADSVYGVINREYATHRAKPDEDVNLLTPLAKGTTFAILGEIGDYYWIDGDTYVFKASVETRRGELPPAIISDASVEEKDGLTAVTFAMNTFGLYEISRTGGKARVTLRGTEDQGGGISAEGTAIAQALKTVGEGAVTWEFTFSEKIIGHSASYSDAGLTVSFRHARQAAAHTLTGACVVLDAGHGGEDPGALGPPGDKGPAEKDFNLYVALAAAQYLASRGADVRLNRRDDTFVPLTDRVEAILEASPDISVSIHANSRPLTSDYGGASGPLMFYTFDESLEAADSIHRVVTEMLDLEYSPPVKENLALTRITNCPAVLFEMSYMSNPGDYERLLLTDELESMGRAIGEGVERVLRNQSAKTGRRPGITFFGALHLPSGSARAII